MQHSWTVPGDAAAAGGQLDAAAVATAATLADRAGRYRVEQRACFDRSFEHSFENLEGSCTSCMMYKSCCLLSNETGLKLTTFNGYLRACVFLFVICSQGQDIAK